MSILKTAQQVVEVLRQGFATNDIRFEFALRPDGKMVVVLGTARPGEPFLPIAEITTAEGYEFLSAPKD